MKFICFFVPIIELSSLDFIPINIDVNHCGMKLDTDMMYVIELVIYFSIHGIPRSYMV